VRTQSNVIKVVSRMAFLVKTDCEAILRRNHCDAVIDSFEVSRLGAYLGFLGEHYKLEIAAIVNKKRRTFSYFVKTLPTSSEEERKTQSEQGFFKKELFVYREIIKDLIDDEANEDDRWCPVFYLGNDDFIVLEDLSLKGYLTLPFRVQYNQRHLETALDALAKFNSCSISYDVQHPDATVGDKLKLATPEKSFVVNNTWLHCGFRSLNFIAMKKSKYGRSHQHLFGLSFYKKLFSFFDRMEYTEVDVVKVLCHRDLWRNNLMFRFEDSLKIDQPNHCMLLDFQVARYLSLPIDVIMLIISNTRKANHQQQNVLLYLKFYYERLRAELSKKNIQLEPILSFEKLYESSKYFKLVALVFNAISLTFSVMPPERFSSLSSEEYAEIMLRNRNDFIGKAIDEDPFYAECIVEGVEELVEYIYDL